MATPKFVPTLSDEGWIKYSSRTKLDFLLSDFFTADGAQSALYQGTLKTFQNIHSMNILDVAAMRDNMQMYLEVYLRPYFSDIKVELDYSTIDGEVISRNEFENTTRIGFFLKCTFTDSSEIVSLDKPVIYEDNIFKYTLDKFNNGIM